VPVYMMSRVSLLVGFLVIECFIFAAVSINAIHSAEESAKETLHHEATVLVEALSPLAVKAIVENDSSEINRSIQSVYRIAKLESVELIDQHGDKHLSAFFDSNSQSNFAKPLSISNPLFHAGDVIGKLHLAVSSSPVMISVNNIENNLSLVALLWIALNVSGIILFRKSLFVKNFRRWNTGENPSGIISANDFNTDNGLEQLNHALINKSPEAILLVDGDMEIVEFNLLAEELFSISRADAIGEILDEVFSLDDQGGCNKLSEVVGSMQSARDGKHLQLKALNSSRVDVSLDVVSFDRSGNNQQSILYFKKAHSYVNEDLVKQYIAKLDDLTNLPCRSVLVEHLYKALQYGTEANRLVVVMRLGLDRFKNINDSLGHHMGNELLVNVARRLSAMMRRGDIVSRDSGDQFVIVLADVSELTNPDTLIQRYIDVFSEPFFVEKHSLHVNVSVGVTVFPNDDTDVEILLRNAESAMFRAKLTSGSSYEYYSNEMRVRSKERLFLENELRTALVYEQFELYYQPQVELVSGKIIGVEALIRWNHPKLGQIPPSRFISLAEETGLIIPIGEWVLRRACEQNMELMKESGVHLTLAINLSARQFSENNLITTVADVLNETRHPAQLLELEITESLLMDNVDEAADVLHVFSKQGIRISMDDFGTGYSSLRYLKKFPINTLKVDRTFVKDILKDVDNASIVSATIKMAHSLNIDIVAEGVETEEQLKFLCQHRCDKIQGYLFSKPLRFTELKSILHENKVMPLPAVREMTSAIHFQ